MYSNSHYKKFWLNKMEADEHDRKILVSGMFLRRNETLQECPSALDSLHDSSLRQISLASESDAATEKGQSLKRLLHDGDLKRSDNSASELPDGAVSRACAVCKTEKTPLWRNGPGGPKSLCNACGIRYKKLGKRIEQQQISMSKIHKRKRNADRGSPADLRMIRRNVGRDEEEAAFLLMGLSCGLVNA